MKLNIPKIVGENMRKMRLDRGLSGLALAERMGTTPQNISGLENGTRGLSAAQIEKLCDEFLCVPADLFEMPDGTDSYEIMKQLKAEIRIMCREDVAALFAKAVSLNASREIKPDPNTF